MKLQELILELSENDIDDFADLNKRFLFIYSENFRHSYSDITTKLLMIRKIPELSIDSLGENLRKFRKYVVSEGRECIFLDNLDKLIDHVQMDIARINEWDNLVNENKLISHKINESNKTSNNLELKLQKTTQNLEVAQKKINSATNEARNVKKELLSIMGIFMAIFSLIQWNFSQYKDLLEYDPFSRVLFVLSIGSLFIISLYCVFSMIDFIVHKNPRMIKPFMNIETRRPTWFGGFTIIGYIVFLSVTLWLLSNDSNRKTISNLEIKIEQLSEDNITQANKNKNELNKKIKDLEEKVEQLEIMLGEKSEYIKSLEKVLIEKNKPDNK